MLTGRAFTPRVGRVSSPPLFSRSNHHRTTVQFPSPRLHPIASNPLPPSSTRPLSPKADEAQLVCEEHEHRISRLFGFRLFPLSQASEWAVVIHEELDPAKRTVVLCHHGVRSMNSSVVSRCSLGPTCGRALDVIRSGRNIHE